MFPVTPRLSILGKKREANLALSPLVRFSQMPAPWKILFFSSQSDF